MQSTIHVSARRNEIAMFSGFNGTHPALEESDATARRIADLIAPEDGPLVLSNKDQGVFYVPSALKVAPFVGKTLARAIELGLATVGKQRSGTHVITGAWAKLDGDGLTEAQLATVQTILCRAGMHIQHPRHLTGNFNAHLRDCLAMFVDEAFFIGDKAGNSVLKSLITEDQMTLEKKGLDVFSVRNRLKIIMATNEDHAVLAGVPA